MNTEQRGKYILESVAASELGGDMYTDAFTLYNSCARQVPQEMFWCDLNYLLQQGSLRLDGERIYSSRQLEREKTAAGYLAEIIQDNSLGQCQPMFELRVGTVYLNAEQRRAVSLALSHRMSLILGGAGTGKTTLVRGILQMYLQENTHFILAAPTGKAAVNLRLHTGFSATTVHSALNLGTEELPFSRVNWEDAKLVIIDEASMMTTEMLAGILENCREDCHVVLIGDDQQLQAVGAGNVIHDLLELGIPAVTLRQLHRQQESQSALKYNVEYFPWMNSGRELLFDNSFQLLEIPESQVHQMICQEAVQRYRAGERVQLLTTINHGGSLSVQALNRAVHPMVNPYRNDAPFLTNGTDTFWQGDRVLVTQNNWSIGCCNGDVGYLRLNPEENPLTYAALELGNERVSYFSSQEHLTGLKHAYALTIHKSQGSEYDTIIMPLAESMRFMLNRKLLYTAISRAKQRVILVGSRVMLDYALGTLAPQRNSGLVERTLRVKTCA